LIALVVVVAVVVVRITERRGVINGCIIMAGEGRGCFIMGIWIVYS
jgi:hypothetical protein